MPRPREIEALEKVTLNLFLGDMQTIRELCPRIGAAKVIRTLVHDWIEENKRKARHAI